MKIGFTERGDAGRDLSWVQACEEHKIDGAVIITKTLTNACGEALLKLHSQIPPDSARHHHRLGRHAYGTVCI